MPAGLPSRRAVHAPPRTHWPTPRGETVRMGMPYLPMLLSPAPSPPTGERWVHEPKLDGWRCLAQVSGQKVRLWSRSGHDWSRLLPELRCLANLGDMVLDGELVAAGPNGRADFELLGARMMGPAKDVPVCLYVFDALAVGGKELVDRTWLDRRAVLDGLDLSDRTDGLARCTVWTSDGTAMHEATGTTGAEGTVSKRRDSLYRAGRSRHWLKAKHSVTRTFDVVGWRPRPLPAPPSSYWADRGRTNRWSGGSRRAQGAAGSPGRAPRTLRAGEVRRRRHAPDGTPHCDGAVQLSHADVRAAARGRCQCCAAGRRLSSSTPVGLVARKSFKHRRCPFFVLWCPSRRAPAEHRNGPFCLWSLATPKSILGTPQRVERGRYRRVHRGPSVRPSEPSSGLGGMEHPAYLCRL